jgi:hypothetical protein
VKAIGQSVDVSRYQIGDVVHFDLVPAGVKPTPDYDLRRLPKLLFLGAAVMVLGVLAVLAGPIRRLTANNG